MVSILCSVWLLTLCQLRQDIDRSSNQLVWTLNKFMWLVTYKCEKINEGGEVKNLPFTQVTTSLNYQ